MTYEHYSKEKGPDRNMPTMTLLKTGQLAANRVCYERYLKAFHYAELLFDRENRKIALRLTNDGTRDAFAIRRIKKGTLAVISAAGFLKHFGIEHQKSCAYAALWNEAEQLLEIQVKQPELLEEGRNVER